MRTWLVVAIALAAALGAAPASAQDLLGPLLAGSPSAGAAAQSRAEASTPATAAVDGLDSAGDAAGRALIAADSTGIVSALMEVGDLLDWMWLASGFAGVLTLAWWLRASGRGGASGKHRRAHDASAIEEAMARAAENHAAKQLLLARAGVRRTPTAAR
ncbi:MAG: hypothetical protein ACOYLQ_00695 [Hyphomicrobiaceae bacterium]|jgi:hypothetical protein